MNEYSHRFSSSQPEVLGYAGEGLIKTVSEIEGMRAAGALAARTLAYACSFAKPGITTNYINHKTESFIRKRGAIPAPLNYGETESRPPFPKSICTSVNEVICHGIPGKTKLKNGDIVCIDITVILDGFHGDSACTVPVGKVSKNARDLMKDTLACLRRGIDAAREGNRLLDIGRAIQAYGESKGRGVVEEFVGHGIGRNFHEPPQVSHVAELRSETPHALEDLSLVPGMIFTIEPMINEASWKSVVLEDGWTAITEDRREISSQYEHTILITPHGELPEILTLLPDSNSDAPAGYEP